MDCFFSLSDFKIENKFIATAETLKFSNNIPVSEYIDYKDYIEDKVNTFVTDLLAKNVKLDKDSTDLSATKKVLEKELDELIILRNNKPDTFTIPYTIENPVYASLQSQIRILQNNLGDNPPTLSKNVPVTNSQVAIEKSKLDRLNKDLINTSPFIYTYVPNLYLKTFKYRDMGKWGMDKEGVDHFLRHREIIEGPPAPRLIGDINVFDPDFQENMIHVFEGTINIEIPAYYNFVLDGDDDCELFINNKLVSHYYGGHGRGNQSYTTEYAIYIEPGIYPIKARMLEWWGASSITAYFIASTKEELDKAHGKQPTYTLDSDFKYIHNSYRRTKPVQTLLQINGPNKTNYVFVQKIADPNPLYSKLQKDIVEQENILKNTPEKVDNYVTVTNSIYTDIQKNILKKLYFSYSYANFLSF